MILAESKEIPTIIQIPRQIPQQELIKLMPLEWLSNYEQFHQNSEPIQLLKVIFKKISMELFVLPSNHHPVRPQNHPGYLLPILH